MHTYVMSNKCIISTSQKIKVPQLLMAHLYAFVMACRFDLEKNT